MFHNGSWARELTLFENLVEVMFDYPPYPPYGIQQTGKIVELKIRESARDRFLVRERSRLEGLHFDPVQARDKRLINLGKQCKEIGVDIPIDPRFID